MGRDLHALSRENWHPWFERMSRVIEGRQASIEIDAQALGVQSAALWLPLFGIVHEPRSGLLEIALEGVDHLIRQPQEVFVDIDGLILSSMEVVDADGVRHILRLREPLLLPPPVPGAAAGSAHP